MSRAVYLDYNATTPVAPEVVDAMLPALRENWGNPSSLHLFGARARLAVEEARRKTAALLGCAPEEIVFTSGGTESDNAALVGVAEALRERGRHLVTTGIEHPAVEEACRYLESRGWSVTRVGVERDGRVDPDRVEEAIRADTVLVSLMHANNETGVIQPVAEVAARARARGALVHTDAAQSVGKIPVRVDELGVDLLTVAGHKMYAPKGIGALYLRQGTPFAGLLHGADHEGGRRAGTENVPEIVGLGAACELAMRELDERVRRLREIRDRIERELLRRFPDAIVHGREAARLPNTCSVAIPGADANTLLAELEDVAASAGAACHAGGTEPSRVLLAMGVEPALALSTLRLSTGRTTTPEEADRAVERIAEVASRLRGDRPVTGAAEGAAGEIRLTRFTHGLGCACKLRPRALEEVLAGLTLPGDPRALVDAATADDAAVWSLGDGRALVATVDFFTPVVDDPRDFGRIAAANALSDLYAMGAEPWFALNLVGFPEGRLPLDVLRRILEGAAEVCARAGAAILGGHTIEDPEPKYGMCAVGAVPEDGIWTNAGAKPGDALVLTKPVGTGVLSTALKRGMLSEERARALVETMAELNAAAAEAARRAGGVHACTDITGFGLLGHLREMTRASGVGAEVRASAVPLLDGAREAVRAGAVPGGTLGNREHLEEGGGVAWDREVDETTRLLLCDAQTSGGLLLAVSEENAGAMLQEMKRANVPRAAIIGRITPTPDGKIRIREQ